MCVCACPLPLPWPCVATTRRCPLWLALRRTSALPPCSNSKLGNGPPPAGLVTAAVAGLSRDAVRALIIGAPTTGFLDPDGWRSCDCSRCLSLPRVLVKSPNSGEQRPSRSESEDSPPVGCIRGGVERGRRVASAGSGGT